MFISCFRRENVINIIKRFYKRSVTNYDLETYFEKQMNCEMITSYLNNYFDLIEKYPKAEHDEFFLKNGFVPIVTGSTVPEGGAGVYLQGEVEAGKIVGIYPGLIYEPGDPSFFPSIKNDYFLRRNDGSNLDGKFYGLSGWMYRSSLSKNTHKDDDGNIIPFADATWITDSRDIHKLLKSNNTTNTNQSESPSPLGRFSNPLATGHFINCASDGKRANVMYFDFNFNYTFNQKRKFIPNIGYSNSLDDDEVLVKSLLIVSLRRIQDEELFTDYSFIGTSDGN